MKKIFALMIVLIFTLPVVCWAIQPRQTKKLIFASLNGEFNILTNNYSSVLYPSPGFNIELDNYLNNDIALTSDIGYKSVDIKGTSSKMKFTEIVFGLKYFLPYPEQNKYQHPNNNIYIALLVGFNSIFWNQDQNYIGISDLPNSYERENDFAFVPKIGYYLPLGNHLLINLGLSYKAIFVTNQFNYKGTYPNMMVLQVGIGWLKYIPGGDCTSDID